MGLQGTAAVVIWTEIDASHHAEHDRWHGSEHLPERLSIPGFLRGRRHAAIDPGNPEARFIFYELADIRVATSAPYLERLNNPTPWSKKLMQLSRLRRALCRIMESRGEGVGNFALVARLAAPVAVDAIARRPGVVAAHCLQRDGAVVRPRTNEEKLRIGASDATADVVVIVEGTSLPALHDAVRGETWHGEAREYGLGEVRAREDLPVR